MLTLKKQVLPEKSAPNTEAMQNITEAMRNIRESMASDNHPDTDVLELTDKVEETSTTEKNLGDLNTFLTQPKTELTDNDNLQQNKTAAYQNELETLKGLLQEQNNSSPVENKNTTLEDFMIEALRPQLKKWMDENLSRVVKEVAEIEIKKLISKISK